MKYKLLFPILALALALLGCNLTGTPTAPSPVPPVVTATNTAPTLAPTGTSTLPAPTIAPTGLTLDVLRNATYFAPVFKRTVTLVNGAFSVNNGTDTYSVKMLNVYAFGDLNGDGVDDAAVILMEDDGGTGRFESVVAVYNTAGAPVQAGQAILGDRVLVNSVDISSNAIHLDILAQGPSDPMCCPSLAQKQTYWMIATTLWQMRVTSTVGGSEHVINITSPAEWADVNNPFTITGAVPISPFENTLAYHIYLPNGTKVNDASLMVTSGGMGTPGTFSQTFNLSSAGITGYVIIQFVEVSMADGSTIALGSALVNVH